MITIALTTDNNDSDASTGEIEEAVREALENADEDILDELSLHSGSRNNGSFDQNSDWVENGCPHCGNDRLSIMEVIENKYKIADGEKLYLERGEVGGPTLSYFCLECHQSVSTHPADGLLAYG
jgi:hypothetical protein